MTDIPPMHGRADTAGALGRLVAVAASAAAVIATVVALGVTSDSSSGGTRISEQVLTIHAGGPSTRPAPAPASSTSTDATTPPGLTSRAHRAEHRCTVATERELRLVVRTFGADAPSRSAAKALLASRFGLSGHALSRALAAVRYLAADRRQGVEKPLALAIGRTCVE